MVNQIMEDSKECLPRNMGVKSREILTYKIFLGPIVVKNIQTEISM